MYMDMDDSKMLDISENSKYNQQYCIRRLLSETARKTANMNYYKPEVKKWRIEVNRASTAYFHHPPTNVYNLVGQKLVTEDVRFNVDHSTSYQPETNGGYPCKFAQVCGRIHQDHKGPTNWRNKEIITKGGRVIDHLDLMRCCEHCNGTEERLILELSTNLRGGNHTKSCGEGHTDSPNSV